MSHDVTDYYEVYSETSRLARKEHTCGACKETIPAGARYTVVFIKFDGVEWLKRCRRCQKIHEHLRTKGDGNMWPDEHLNCGEEYRDHWGEDPPPEIAALAFALPGDP